MKKTPKRIHRKHITDTDRINWLSLVSRTREVTFYRAPGNGTVRAGIDKQIRAAANTK